MPMVANRTHSLTVNRHSLIGDMALALRMGHVYRSGTVTVASGVVTFANADDVPSNAADMTMEFFGQTKRYTINTRDSATQVTLDDTALNITEVTNYMMYRMTTEQMMMLDMALRSALTIVYHPAEIPGIGQHQWTWLFPWHDFSTADGQRFYPLPPDFDAPMGNITFEGATGQNSYSPIVHVSTGRLEALDADTTYTSVPREYAVYPINSTGQFGDQLYQIGFHPTPDSTYNLRIPYRTFQGMLTNRRPFPAGGASHGELFSLACVYKAHEKVDGIAHPNTQAAKTTFMERLLADIRTDLERQPRFLGWNLSGNYDEDIGNFETLVKEGVLLSGNLTYNTGS